MPWSAHARFADALLRVLLCTGSTGTHCQQFLDGQFHEMLLKALFLQSKSSSGSRRLSAPIQHHVSLYSKHDKIGFLSVTACNIWEGGFNTNVTSSPLKPEVQDHGNQNTFSTTLDACQMTKIFGQTGCALVSDRDFEGSCTILFKICKQYWANLPE